MSKFKTYIARPALFSAYILAPLAGVMSFYTWQDTTGNGYLKVGVYAGSAILIGLVLLRQIFVMREAGGYAGRLQRLNTELQIMHDELNEKNARLESLATTDVLTGVLNHRSLVSTIDRELERAERYQRPCSLFFLDIDHFKALNEGHGHQAGDTVLREIAGSVRALLRSIDTPGRWGGEEFVVILPETNGEAALIVAERIRAAISMHTFPVSSGVHMTCSLGIASFPSDARERDRLVEVADQAMYAAKRLGRNQVRRITDPVVIALETETVMASSREEMTVSGIVDALTAMVEARDNYTGRHTRRVGELTIQLALALGLDASETYMIGLAGRLHDIGKVTVPDAILLKPGRLTEEEWVMMRKHAAAGADIVSRIPSLRALAPIIHAHHEHWNGAGYPAGLVAEAIPLGARIITVVDSYEAITTDRPYQKARDASWAVSELRRCAGSQFDPDIVDALEGVLIAHRTEAELVEASRT